MSRTGMGGVVDRCGGLRGVVHRLTHSLTLVCLAQFHSSTHKQYETRDSHATILLWLSIISGGSDDKTYREACNIVSKLVALLPSVCIERVSFMV